MCIRDRDKSRADLGQTRSGDRSGLTELGKDVRRRTRSVGAGRKRRRWRHIGDGVVRVLVFVCRYSGSHIDNGSG